MSSAPFSPLAPFPKWLWLGQLELRNTTSVAEAAYVIASSQVENCTTMNPHISLPRPTGGPSNFGSTHPSSRRESLRMPRFFKRLFKFPQMDFEMALWEMLNLIIAPQKVFRSIYYHVNIPYYPSTLHCSLTFIET